MRVLLCLQFEPLVEGHWVMASRKPEVKGMIYSCEVCVSCICWTVCVTVMLWIY